MKKGISGIYCIRHIDTGKCYVGESWNIRERFYWHKIKMPYAWKDLKAEILEFMPSATKAERLIRESHWVNALDAYHRGFNKTPDGNTGHVWDEVKRLNHSESRKGIVFTEEHCCNISKAKKGQPNNWTDRKHTDVSKQKMRDAKLGVPRSQEVRKRVSEGYKQSDRYFQRLKMRAEVIKLWLTGIYTQKEIATLMGLHRDTISNYLKGVKK